MFTLPKTDLSPALLVKGNYQVNISKRLNAENNLVCCEIKHNPKFIYYILLVTIPSNNAFKNFFLNVPMSVIPQNLCRERPVIIGPLTAILRQ